jgi:hypothetical protein
MGKLFKLIFLALIPVFLIAGSKSGSCADISNAGVKKTSNFPLYDLPTNDFPQQQVFGYYPLSNADEYSRNVMSNGFVVNPIDSNNEIRLYVHAAAPKYVPDVSVLILLEASSGKFGTTILYISKNEGLLKKITPLGVPLVQYQLTEQYVGDRAFVKNHLTKYISDLKSLGFKQDANNTDEWKKQVGNCVYYWFYKYQNSHLKSTSNVYIDYHWVIADKDYANLEWLKSSQSLL